MVINVFLFINIFLVIIFLFLNVFLFFMKISPFLLMIVRGVEGKGPSKTFTTVLFLSSATFATKLFLSAQAFFTFFVLIISDFIQFTFKEPVLNLSVLFLFNPMLSTM